MTKEELLKFFKKECAAEDGSCSSNVQHLAMPFTEYFYWDGKSEEIYLSGAFSLVELEIITLHMKETQDARK